MRQTPEVNYHDVRKMAMKTLLVFRRWWVVFLWIGVAGCGLSDYEKRMDKHQRIVALDETSKLLEDPIEMPMLKKPGSKDDFEAAWPFDVYLRLPKGFGTTVKEQDKKAYDFTTPLFVRYSNNEPD